MVELKGVIFDCDGVLVDSEAIGCGVLVEMANEYGAGIDLDYAYKNFKGSFITACIENIESRINSKLPEDFMSEYRQRSYARFKKDITPIAGIEKVLNGLDLPFCVASSGPQEKIKLNLGLTGLLPHFEDYIFSCYDIGKWKPDPAIFLHAAEQLQLAPESCLVVEDSPQGIQAALVGGFTVFGFKPHQAMPPLEGAHRVFEDMAQLLKLIETFPNG